MTKKIFKSICAVAIAVAISAILIFTVALYNYFSDQMKSDVQEQATLVAHGIEGNGADYFKALDTELRITWIDKDGTVLYDTMNDASQMKSHADREEFQEALQTGTGESSRYSNTLLEKYYYYAESLENGTVVRVARAQHSVWALVFKAFQPIGAVLIIALIIAALLASRLSRNIVEPINHISLDRPLEAPPYDEIVPLLQRINNQQRQLAADKRDLEKAEQIRRDFTANVSHELKTPLHSISGYAELIKDGIAKESDVKPFATQIYAESQRLSTLVEDIIDLSHLDAGATDMTKEPADVYQIATHVVDSLTSIAGEREVSLDLQGAQAPITCNPKLVHTIIYNLCDNAIKYNQPGGKVTLSIKTISVGTSDNATQNNDVVVIEVADTGIGMSAEDCERAFERFYRVDKSHSKEVGGTGLGLSIVKHAVKVHDGTIDVKSEPNKGTTFTVTLPAN